MNQSRDEVVLEISQLNPKKANRPENIPNKFLNSLSPIISPYLANVFNKCFKIGMFPDIQKQAKVIPVYKSSPKNLPSNYRPISLLSPISKVFEKLLYMTLEKCFSLHNVITNQQFGFRKDYSTEMAITDLSDTLKHNIDEGLLHLLHINSKSKRMSN